mmetsp:Transcript_4984/g.10479  ORF Transcript_4984/g.10479 Transcript_4984/m.10479 type:complete len:163 (-) Transcript_4984:210-698(-)
MSYFQEGLSADPFFSDETEEDEDEEEEYSIDSQSSPRSKVAVESDTDKDDPSGDAARYRYNPSRPAYLQLLLQHVAMPEQVQSPRQSKNASKNKKATKKTASTKAFLKQCCLGGNHSKTNTHHNNFNTFDCGFSVDQPGTGILCDCGLYSCVTSVFTKLRSW